MIPPPSVSRLWAGGIFYRPHLLAFLDFYFFLLWPSLVHAGLALRAMKKPQIGRLWVHAHTAGSSSAARPAHGFLFIAPASWVANHLAKPTDHSGINFRQYVYILTKWPTSWQTDLLLTIWPISWQPDLLPTTWPIFLVVDMSSC